MDKIATVILTKNEEKNIEECLESLSWCSNIFVLDSFSTDRTIEIANKKGVKVLQHPFNNFANQRNTALEMVDSEWVLFVDADERVTPELAEEVNRVVQDPEYVGWWVPRRNNYFGRWLFYGGFYPDYQFRLVKKGNNLFDSKQKVHEKPMINGTVGYLKNPLVHLCYQDLGDLLEAKSRYARLLAEIHYEKGVLPTYHLLAAPILTFFQQLIRLKGYKDGKVGWLISVVWGYYAFLEYWKIWGIWYKKRILGKM
jgi:glycosyltransferase involved in cell wall biosynthesis